MAEKNIVTKIDDDVAVRNVIVSVSDKAGLESFIPALVGVCPGVMIYSTGGTFSRLEDILGKGAGSHLKQVSDYTGQPEMQGGLVKTLDFKIYLGLLSETYNDAHAADLKRTGAVKIDMAVVNLYPFQETIAKLGATPEDARANIDIGGPSMVRASAKNFIRVASVTDPADYNRILEELQSRQGKISLKLRYELARKAFEHTAAYDRAILEYLAKTDMNQVEKAYPELVR
jgi:phosphoribosylaminoimidazolecarboxamide formyltransferase/IMP cyclohydrolase